MIIPPAPVGTPFGSFTWADWYQKLRNALNDIVTDHNDLTNIQGGNSTERYHLTNAEYQTITANLATLSYTATGYTGTNISAVTPGIALYQRVGDTVRVAGTVAVTVTAATTPSTFALDIPIPSTLGATPNTTLFGTFSSSTHTHNGGVANNGSNNRATFSFVSTTTGSTTLYYSYTYKKI